jgi:hypothetical protein
MDALELEACRIARALDEASGRQRLICMSLQVSMELGSTTLFAIAVKANPTM